LPEICEIGGTRQRCIGWLSPVHDMLMCCVGGADQSLMSIMVNETSAFRTGGGVASSPNRGLGREGGRLLGFNLNVSHSRSWKGSYLVDPASSHMLVSKIKPCMSKYKRVCTVKLRMAH
jgi:hypothetical protein